ncbi:MAG TPA: hypothetical protein IAB87_08805 [Candidatus Coprenecus merdipullorum]|nr:hypothetical protein [Candidatus Coprenecus merdipullorum]
MTAATAAADRRKMTVSSRILLSRLYSSASSREWSYRSSESRSWDS